MGTRIRQAGAADALEVAAIIDIGGHGIDLDRWLQRRDGDHSVIAAARQLVLDESNAAYHFSKAHLIEVDGVVAGGLVGGLAGATPDVAESSSSIARPCWPWSCAFRDTGQSLPLRFTRNFAGGGSPPG